MSNATGALAAEPEPAAFDHFDLLQPAVALPPAPDAPHPGDEFLAEGIPLEAAADVAPGTGGGGSTFPQVLGKELPMCLQ